MALDSERIRLLAQKARVPYSGGGKLPTIGDGKATADALRAYLSGQPLALGAGPQVNVIPGSGAAIPMGAAGSSGAVPNMKTALPGPNAAARVSAALPAQPTATAAPAAQSLFARMGAKVGMGAGTANTAAGATKLGLGRAAGVAGVGYMASGIVNSQNVGGEGSNTDQALSGALTGAGIGAGVGLMGGPFAPISVPVGTAVGALSGAAVGLFGPKKDKAKAAQKASDKIDASTAKQLETLSGLTAGLPDDVRQAMVDDLMGANAEMKAALAPKSKDPMEAYGQQLIAQIPQIQAQYRAAEKAKVDQEHSDRATANQIGTYMAPYLAKFTETSERAAQAYEARGDTARAATARNSGARMAAAYAAQTSAGPALFRQQAEASYNSQIAQQRQQYDIAAQLKAEGYGAGAGTATLEEIAAGG